MHQRSEDDCLQDLQNTAAAHIANEVQRDAFVSLGHTALFAASIAFIGDVAKPGEAIWLPVLYLAWISSVVGLLALTASFEAASKFNEVQRSSVYQREFRPAIAAPILNRLALWTFPISLVFLALFAGRNIGNS